jgi:hypothetical protein
VLQFWHDSLVNVKVMELRTKHFFSQKFQIILCLNIWYALVIYLLGRKPVYHQEYKWLLYLVLSVLNLRRRIESRHFVAGYLYIQILWVHKMGLLWWVNLVVTNVMELTPSVNKGNSYRNLKKTTSISYCFNIY